MEAVVIVGVSRSTITFFPAVLLNTSVPLLPVRSAYVILKAAAPWGENSVTVLVADQFFASTPAVTVTSAVEP